MITPIKSEQEMGWQVNIFEWIQGRPSLKFSVSNLLSQILVMEMPGLPVVQIYREMGFQI